MFIPLGFGSRLKKFPFAIILITAICIYWSFEFFENIEKSTAEIYKVDDSIADENNRTNSIADENNRTNSTEDDSKSPDTLADDSKSPDSKTTGNRSDRTGRKENILLSELMLSVCEERKLDFCDLLKSRAKKNARIETLLEGEEDSQSQEFEETILGFKMNDNEELDVPSEPTQEIQLLPPLEDNSDPQAQQERDQQTKELENLHVELRLQLQELPKDATDAMDVDNKQNAFNTKDTRDIGEIFSQTASLAKFAAEFAEKPEKWAADIQKNPKYKEYINYIKTEIARVNAIHKKHGFLTSESFTFMRLLRASFTHGGFGHLFSNLLIMILVGLWVEQRAGSLMTAALFLLGSFVGLGAQIMIMPDRAVLGASAGIFSLMGMFFVFFFHKEIRFLFSLFPIYFRVLSLPALWTFPFFYLLGDLIAVQAGSNSGVASYAHLGGLVVGLTVGLFLRQADELGLDEAYLEEKVFIHKLKNSEGSDRIWKYFKELMEWNCQNWNGLKIFLERANAGQVDINPQERQKFLQKSLRVAAVHYLKRGDISKMLDFIKQIPPSLDLAPCLKDTPVSQILFLADHLANAQDYTLARRLYKLALEKEPKDPNPHVHEAIHKIDSIMDQSSASSSHADNNNSEEKKC